MILLDYGEAWIKYHAQKGRHMVLLHNYRKKSRYQPREDEDRGPRKRKRRKSVKAFRPGFVYS